MKGNRSLLIFGAGRWTVPLLLLGLAAPSMARNPYLPAWQDMYPGSASDDNVINGTGSGCQLCHQSEFGGNGWNGYGWDIRQGLVSGLTVAQAIQAAEPADSDMDPTATANLGEINTDTQPGWTSGPNNTIYFSGGTIISGQLPPAGILANLDPISGQLPDINLNPSSLSFGSVSIGSTVVHSAQVQNLGTATLNVTSVGRCAGTSAEYSWSPGAPFTVAPGGSQTLSVTYTPADTGSDAGCLAIGSNDPDELSVELGLTGSGSEPQPAQLDLDIAGFQVDKRISLKRPRAVSIKLNVSNGGTVDGQTRPATVIGVQQQGNATVEVYSQTLMVSAPVGKKKTTFEFPPYEPTVAGTITWTAEILDDNPDDDTATASTEVN